VYRLKLFDNSPNKGLKPPHARLDPQQHKKETKVDRPTAQTAAEMTTYSGSAVAAVAGWFSLSQLGVIVGIITALIGLAAQIYFSVRRERRERELHKLKVEQLKHELK